MIRKYSPTPKLFLGVGSLLILSMLILLAEQIVTFFLRLFGKGAANYKTAIISLLSVACILFVVAITELMLRSNKRRIQYLLQRKFCEVKYGNPLNLKEGEYLPVIKVFEHPKGYQIRISCKSAKFSDLLNLESSISSYLTGRFNNFSVISKTQDIACNYVEYIIQDVVSNANKQSKYRSIEDIPSEDVTKRYIRDDVYIDYSKVLNSSALICGRSRSGKTTGIISTFILPTLKQGADKFGSRVIIIDPKSAELSSCCPFVLSPDINGSAEKILKVINGFNDIRVKRQQVLNQHKGSKWFQIGMKPSILFIDEFVSFLDLFPARPSKDNLHYCLSDIQSLLQQIATMGASAGCFLIISVAEASVGAGGIPSIINNACGIRILFKPSKQEARYLWSADKLETMNEREFMPGDAWFSAEDGINNNVSFIKFPKLEFNEFEALSDLLIKYYKRN